ncbi:BQ5605_C011g06371 [Microbotryum silenes-dioicae]|uniref:BQ5605_C011g06371 protein n=1 Tax=Microbotryum silenes-dioicae TaxID=796604 RepID=A0A2X0LS94_9BASI|nr:BQ5605_C011g06371 [Microbotryum silenes-dioicae]
MSDSGTYPVARSCERQVSVKGLAIYQNPWLGTCQPIGGRKSSRKATDLGRRWQRYTAILVRQRQAVGTERCGRSWLGKLLRKCGLQTKARGRRAGHGLLQEGQAYLRLSIPLQEQPGLCDAAEASRGCVSSRRVRQKDC